MNTIEERIKSAIAYEYCESSRNILRSIVGKDFELVENDTTINVDIDPSLIAARLAKLCQKLHHCKADQLWNYENLSEEIVNYLSNVDTIKYANELFAYLIRELFPQSLFYKWEGMPAFSVLIDNNCLRNYYDLVVLNIGNETLRIPLPIFKFDFQMDLLRVSILNGTAGVRIPEESVYDSNESYTLDQWETFENIISSLFHAILPLHDGTSNSMFE